MEADAKKVGKRIKMLRQENELTLKELDKKLSIPFTTINSWERGISLPRKKTLSVLAKFFDVDENWLLFGTLEEYLNDIIVYYNLSEQVNEKDVKNFKDYLTKKNFTVGNFKKLKFYAQERLPALIEVIDKVTKENQKKLKSLHDIGVKYPIIKKEIVQDKILPLLQILLSDKNKEMNKKMIEDYLLKMFLNK